MLWLSAFLNMSFLNTFWDNCELVVLSHLLEKFGTFLQMYDGVHFLCVLYCLWKAEFSSQPISEYWNQMTTLIPFLQVIKHFCNFIPSYFMERFAFLIEDTSYVCFMVETKIFDQRDGSKVFFFYKLHT